MATTNTYLTFNGNCEEAFNFYKTVFGGNFGHIARFSDIPSNAGYPVTEADEDKIMHISLPIGSSVLMGADTGDEWDSSLVQGNNFSVFVSVTSRDEAERIFSSFSQYGEISIPLSDTFWGAFFGAVIDEFGINWMISFDERAQIH